MATTNTDLLVPPSAGKVNKARRVFGDVVVNDMNQSECPNESLCYSPSPMQPPARPYCGESKKFEQEPFVTALFTQKEEQEQNHEREEHDQPTSTNKQTKDVDKNQQHLPVDKENIPQENQKKKK